MKYLGVILILYVGVAVIKAVPIDLIEENDLEINVTLIPFNETTPGAPQTLNPATGQTISAATMPPATGKTDTAPTIQPITFTKGSQTTVPTSQPTVPTTNPAMTSEASMSSSMETMTMGPTTVAPTTGSTGTGSTKPSKTTHVSVHTTKTTKTTVAPQPTPKPKHGFDGGSFAGGIALGVGIAAIILIAYRCYIIRHKAKGYGDVN